MSGIFTSAELAAQNHIALPNHRRNKVILAFLALVCFALAWWLAPQAELKSNLLLVRLCFALALWFGLSMADIVAADYSTDQIVKRQLMLRGLVEDAKSVELVHPLKAFALGGTGIAMLMGVVSFFTLSDNIIMLTLWAFLMGTVAYLAGYFVYSLRR